MPWHDIIYNFFFTTLLAQDHSKYQGISKVNLQKI